jgi:hypothetical protein
MYSKEIDGKMYDFKFGIGFVRDIDKTKTVKADDGSVQKLGLTYAIAGLMDGDFEKLIDCLMYGNKYSDGEKLDRRQIEEWLESDDVSLEQECRDLLDFFESANFTSRKTRDLREAMEKNRELQEADYQSQLERAKAGMN